MQAVVAPTSISVVLPTFNHRERLEASLAAADLGVPLCHTRQVSAGSADALLLDERSRST